MKEYLLKPITETAEQAIVAKGQKAKIAKQILLGIDSHVNSYQVCRKIDAGGLQPVESFTLEKLLLFGYKQLQLAEKVYAVYEAGPLGNVLYRKGYRTKGSWWRPGAFSKLRASIPEWISQELALWQVNLALLYQQIAQLKTELAQSHQGPRPKGAGLHKLAGRLVALRFTPDRCA